MPKSSRYDAEIEYLSDYRTDVLRELSWMITPDGACYDFEPRNAVGSIDCRHCAFAKEKH